MLTCCGLLLTTKFQSTLPRGSDLLLVQLGNKAIISIHAPSRERLQPPALTMRYIIISIHAPSRERPTLAPLHSKKPVDFNPRSLAGATHSVIMPLLSLLVFQSTLPRGSDLLAMLQL